MSTSLTKLWRAFRALPTWIQAAAWVVGALVAIAPFSGDPDEVQGAAESPSAWRPTPVELQSDRPPPAAATVTTAVADAPGVPAGGDDTVVDRVVDGDTIVVVGGTRIRFIGVDAPETVDPAAPIGCYGPEASRYLNELIPPGTRVRLLYDVERLDQYGRTLAYVYKLTDGVFVNLAVLRNGFATQLTVAPNVRYAETFRLGVADARTANLGLWSSCHSTTTTAPRVVSSPVTAAPVSAPAVSAAPVTAAPATSPPATRAIVSPTTTPASSGGCHPSYEGACVPTGFSDVDCGGGSGNGPGYVYTKRFRVVGPDVFDLDSDNDGIACES